MLRWQRAALEKMRVAVADVNSANNKQNDEAK